MAKKNLNSSECEKDNSGGSTVKKINNSLECEKDCSDGSISKKNLNSSASENESSDGSMIEKIRNSSEFENESNDGSMVEKIPNSSEFENQSRYGFILPDHDDSSSSDDLESGQIYDTPQAIPAPHHPLRLPTAYLVGNEDSFSGNGGEEMKSNEAEICAVVEPLSVTIVPQTWKKKAITKSYPNLTYERLLNLFYAMIFISAVIAAVTLNTRNQTEILLDSTISPSSFNIDIRSNSPSPSPTEAVVVWNQIGNSVMAGHIDYNVIMGERIDDFFLEDALLPPDGRFSLSYNGNLLAIAGSHKPTLFELKHTDTDDQTRYWSPMVNFPDFFNVTYYSIEMSYDGINFVIGDPFFDNSIGSVNIYQFNSNGKWEQKGQTLVGEQKDDWFGGKVEIDLKGERIAVHASEHVKLEGGCTKVFDYDGNSWIFLKKFNYMQLPSYMTANGKKMIIARDKIVSIEELELFSNFTQMEFDVDISSISVSDDGAIIAIGLEIISSVQVYKLSPGTGKYIQHYTTLRESRTSNFGKDVFVSSNGELLVVSGPSPRQDKNEVKIYHIDDDKIYLTEIIQGDPNITYDVFPVKFSGDGSVIAVGFYGFKYDYPKSYISTFEMH